MRQNVVDNFFSSIIFCHQHEICCVSPKLSMRSCEKKLLPTKKTIDLFSFFRRENSSMRFSDLTLIDNTKYEFVAVFQNSH